MASQVYTHGGKVLHVIDCIKYEREPGGDPVFDSYDDWI